MFPFRYRSIFRSRWMALLWAAGICWTALSLVPDKAGEVDPSASKSGVSADDVEALGALLQNATE
jgi:hypothetical protein